jgi:hypothetical protein
MDEEVRKRMTSSEFAYLISNNCAVMGRSSTESERQMYQELREQDITEGIPVEKEIKNKGILYDIWNFCEFIYDVVFLPGSD